MGYLTCGNWEALLSEITLVASLLEQLCWEGLQFLNAPKKGSYPGRPRTLRAFIPWAPRRSPWEEVCTTQSSADYELAGFPLLQGFALLLRSCEVDVSIQSEQISTLPVVITGSQKWGHKSFFLFACWKKNYSSWGSRVTRYLKLGSSCKVGDEWTLWLSRNTP